MKRPAPVRPTSAAPAPAPSGEFDWKDPTQRVPLIMLGVGTLLVVAAYWDTIKFVATRWDEPLYSHGWLIPAFAAVLMYLKIQPFKPVPAKDRWWGLGILSLGLFMRIAGSFVYSNPVDQLSFLVVLFGVFVLIGGLQVVRWAGPAIGFLVFMLPWPSVLERNILLNLQKLATMASTVIFQILGFSAHRRGNWIDLPGVPHDGLNVAEACSGLRMTTIFLALSVAVVLLIERPWWDKLVILLSAIPIALLVNTIRITVTGLLLMTAFGEKEDAAKIIHDVAGYVMPIMAMGFMWLELAILQRLSVADSGPHMAGVGGGAKQPRRSAPIPR